MEQSKFHFIFTALDRQTIQAQDKHKSNTRQTDRNRFILINEDRDIPDPGNLICRST